MSYGISKLQKEKHTVSVLEASGDFEETLRNVAEEMEISRVKK